MPTIIDELVVKLGLDPTDFDAGDARLVQSLRRMENSAQRGAQQLQERVGASTVQFFRMLESPISGLRRHFEDLATYADAPRQQLRQLEDDGRRMGEGVEGGALAGARGLRVLGAAGLGVFAAYEALSKTISAATVGAERLFGTGIGAAAAGVGINEFTAISQALLRGGNVPQEQTQATLGAWRGAQLGYARGDEASIQNLVGLNQGLARLGITDVDVFRDPPEQIMQRLAAHFAAMPADQALSAGQSLGLTPQQVYGMRQVGTGLQASTEAERARAATEAQHGAASRLVEATNNLSNAWDNLGRIMGRIVDGPIARLENALAWILDRFAGQGERDPGSVTSTIGSAFGPAGTIAGYLAGNAPPAGPSDTRSFWQRIAPTWLGGRDAPQDVPGAVPAGGGSTARLAVGGGSNLVPGLTTDDVAIMQRESGGRPSLGWGGMPGSPDYSPGGTDLSGYPLDETGFPDWPGKMGPAGLSTAAGLWQITKSNWHRIAPRLGIHDFSPESQLRVRRELQRERIAAGQAPNADWAASGTVLPVGPAIADVQRSTSDIQRAQAQVGSSTVTHNAGDVNLHGDIVVNAPLREGNAIAGAVEDRVRRVQLATTSNTGLE